MNLLEWLKGLFGGEKEETGAPEESSEQPAGEQPASGEQSEPSDEQPQQ